MGDVVVTEFVTLEDVFEDPGGSESSQWGGWAFRFDRGPEGDKFKVEETMNAGAMLLGRWFRPRRIETATWRSGYATVCKTVYPGSIPGVASSSFHRPANSIQRPHRRLRSLPTNSVQRDRFKPPAAKAAPSPRGTDRRQLAPARPPPGNPVNDDFHLNCAMQQSIDAMR